jgi:PBP1b-binding outer membrane lipoprotein LpoB
MKKYCFAAALAMMLTGCSVIDDNPAGDVPASTKV